MTDTANILFLVPVDFSPQSLIAADQAHNLAYYFGGELVLLNVFEHGGFISKLFSNDSASYILKKRHTEDLDSLAQKLHQEKKVKVRTLLSEGDVWEEILVAAERLKVSFIVMSALQSKRLKNSFIATNTMRVVREAFCPVITIRGEKHRQGCKNIVIPLDLSKESRQKVSYAIGFAKRFNNTTIHMVSVIDTGSKKQIDRLKSQMNDVKYEIETQGINCKAEFVKIINSEDTIANAILAYSKRVKADVIIIMTQQEKNPTDFFIGSSATAIINNSDIPVMSIIPKKEIKSKFF